MFHYLTKYFNPIVMMISNCLPISSHLCTGLNDIVHIKTSILFDRKRTQLHPKIYPIYSPKSHVGQGWMRVKQGVITYFRRESMESHINPHVYPIKINSYSYIFSNKGLQEFICLINYLGAKCFLRKLNLHYILLP